MARKSFVTTMPDKSGAFLRASKIIAAHGGNIVRVSYNKAVDLRMLFLDIEAGDDSLFEIERELTGIGYLHEKIIETRVIEVSVRIPDASGAVLPVLEILNRHDINISYLNSASGDSPWQDFKMGLLIEDPRLIKTLLDEISAIYPIDIIQCDSSEENLDNTVFYIRLANEMQGLLGIGPEETMEFITESNRILQILQTGGEDARKVFAYIRRFASFVSSHRGENFRVNIERVSLSQDVTLYALEPPCGSNTYVLEAPETLTLLDTGYAVYAPEMMEVFLSLWPDFRARPKRIYITHADVDHCGLLSVLTDAEIILNQKSAQSLKRQAAGIPDYRENTQLGAGYSKISRIISGYRPADPARFQILDCGTPEEHDDMREIGHMTAGDLDFTICEGSGGHLKGEMVYVCRKAGAIFTGDLLVNISGFSQEVAEFNSLAPYLIKSVNMNSAKATQMRHTLLRMAETISLENGRPCVLFCGHGPVSVVKDGRLMAYGGGIDSVLAP